MTRMTDDDALRILRDAMRPAHHSAGAPDAWPRVERRLQTPRQAPTTTDWLLIAAAIALCLIYPSAVIMPLMHF